MEVIEAAVAAEHEMCAKRTETTSDKIWTLGGTFTRKNFWEARTAAAVTCTPPRKLGESAETQKEHVK